MEDSFSSAENSDIEVDVKIEVDAFDAIDSMPSPSPPPPPPPSVKTSAHNLRRNRSAIVKGGHVQPKIESVFLEASEFQQPPDVADFSIDRIKSESESNDDDDYDDDQDDNDWQNDKNANAEDVVEVKKYKKKRQFCPNCSMSYSKREYLKKHMLKEHNAELEKVKPGKYCEFYVDDGLPRPYRCDQCDKRYMRSKHLARHRRTHFEKERCNQCNLHCQNLAEHMLEKHGIVLDAISADGIKNGVDATDGDNESQPNKIVNAKPSETAQDKPPKVKMEQDQSEIDDANDNENSASNKKRKREKVESKDESTRCIPCNRKFHDIRKHWVQYHSGIDRPFECYVCRRNYKRYEHIKHHLKTHGDERDYVCHVCGDAFFLSNELRKHIMYRHQTERPFKCTHAQCKKSFKNMHALNVHSRTHSGAKPFVCKHISYSGVACSEAFAALSSLRIHERKHTGEKVKLIRKTHKFKVIHYLFIFDFFNSRTFVNFVIKHSQTVQRISSMFGYTQVNVRLLTLNASFSLRFRIFYPCFIRRQTVSVSFV